MTRRGKSSAAEDFMNLVALLPWWAGVTLAVVSYLVSSWIAARPVVVTAQPGQMGGAVSLALWKGLATAGQYIVPVVCLAGAGLSAFRRRQRRQLLTSAARSPAADALDGMPWQEFEMLVGEAFRRQGYRVIESGGGGADGGVDLVLSRPARSGTEKVLVQCKHCRNLRLIDGPALQGLVREAQSARPRGSTGQAAQPDQGRVAPPPASATYAPTCPDCGKTMVQRTAKRRTNAGNPFWGCTGYPTCRGTRQVA